MDQQNWFHTEFVFSFFFYLSQGELIVNKKIGARILCELKPKNVREGDLPELFHIRQITQTTDE